MLSDIQVMLRLPAEECGTIKRLIGPSGHLIKHLWTWICPLFIGISLLIDIFTKNTERAKRVGDSNLWHCISMISIAPLLSFLYYIYIKVRKVMRKSITIVF